MGCSYTRFGRDSIIAFSTSEKIVSIIRESYVILVSLLCRNSRKKDKRMNHGKSVRKICNVLGGPHSNETVSIRKCANSISEVK